MSSYQELYDFVDRAKRNRKYPEATAQSLRAALKVYDAELSDEERASIAKVKGDFEQITRSVFNKNASKFTASSLATYKSRVLKVFTDFEKYADPAKMNNWMPRVINRARKPQEQSATLGRLSTPLPSDIEAEEAAGQPHVFSDKGQGWSLVIRSTASVNSEVKTKLISVADLLTALNKSDVE
jgi:hypothetical protein